MNITFYTMNTEFPDYYSASASIDKTKASENGASANYDRLTINSPKLPADDTGFAKMLARESVRQLERGADSERVRRIQQQVRSGAYTPDARRIAEHMLGYRS